MYRYPLGLPHCVCSLYHSPTNTERKPKLYQGKWPITNPAEHHQRCWKSSGDCLGSAGRSESGECSKLRRAPSFEHRITMFTGNIMINHVILGVITFSMGHIWRTPWGMIRWGSSRKGTDVADVALAAKEPGQSQNAIVVRILQGCKRKRWATRRSRIWWFCNVWSLNNGKTMSLQSRRRCKGRKHVETNVNIHYTPSQC